MKLNYAKLTGSVPVADIIKTIEQADYQAKLASQPDIKLRLTGLNCRNCVNKTQKALKNIHCVIAALVTTQTAQIFDNAELTELIAVVKTAGYQAALETENKPSISQQLVPPSLETAHTISKQVVSDRVEKPNSDSDTIQLLINGMTCVSCVNKVQKALFNNQEGGQNAHVNLAEHNTLITGKPNHQALIQVVQKASYDA